jgi:A/G-specific adenine glycosylase
VKEKDFVRVVYQYYKKHGRDRLPWRFPALKINKKGDIDPYAILVSEVMLQQTQVDRVIPKYQAFMKKFPTVEKLAQSKLDSVLTLWSGLGYNRRAKFLKRAAEKIAHEYNGKFPRNRAAIDDLPGVGEYTAGAICAFAFNLPELFLETNIRSVYIHHFFPGRNDVHDKELLPLLEKTVDKKKPREWYAALMDYGAHIKSQTINPNRRSTNHKRQPKFSGSLREVRGKILKYMVENGFLATTMVSFIESDGEKAKEAIEGLLSDGLIRVAAKGFRLSS